MVSRVPNSVDRWIRTDDLFYSLDSRSVRPFPNEQATALSTQKYADRCEQECNHDGSCGIKVGVAEHATQKDT